MDVWMDGRRMNEWIYGRMDRQMNGQINGSTEGWTDRLIRGRTVRKIKGRMNGRIDRLIVYLAINEHIDTSLENDVPRSSHLPLAEN